MYLFIEINTLRLLSLLFISILCCVEHGVVTISIHREKYTERKCVTTRKQKVAPVYRSIQSCKRASRTFFHLSPHRSMHPLPYPINMTAERLHRRQARRSTSTHLGLGGVSPVREASDRGSECCTSSPRPCFFSPRASAIFRPVSQLKPADGNEHRQLSAAPPRG